MNLRIRRRRFGQIAIASAAFSAIANFAGKTVAQQAESTIYGVSFPSSADIINIGINKITELIDVNITPALTLISSDLVSGKDVLTQLPGISVNNRDTLVETANKALYTEPSERLTALTPLAGGSFVIVSVASTRTGNFNRIILIDRNSARPQRALRVSGFRRINGTLESLVAIKENSFIGVVSLNEGTPPFDLVNFDFNSAKLNSSNDLPLLPGNLRLSNLTLSPDGTIYATALSSQGSTTLVQLDLENKAIVSGRGKIITLLELKYNNKPLENDLLSLAVAKSGQVFALANPTFEKINSLFSVDLKSGEMKLLRKFPADKIAFARA
ncbi:hypothetical protein H6G81_20730 [Scytonema hofmannii FACHB-248]|uniref:Uncharacterized protein n=1 Tax=Scytonema hofmannii FACHB-248 TaxID=1842502 RepID=A0ABR8GUX7_9CYAN|nr:MULTISPECIES: hypothetical protein [Nostocales]MBD2606890.1 hypothetical protein [Scytonema hofmannii FACHB-248]